MIAAGESASEAAHPPAPASAAGPSGAGGEARRFPLVRVLVGLVLVGAALCVVFLPRGTERLELTWVVRELPGGGARPVSVRSVRPGRAYRLMVGLRPGRGAPQGSSLGCSSASRPRISVGASDVLVFENPAGFLHSPGDAVPLDFTVSESASPGPVPLLIRAEAELLARSGVRVRSAEVAKTVTLTVTRGD